MLHAEDVLADGIDNGAGTDPLVGGGPGIIIVNRAAAGIYAVERISGRPIGGIGHRLVKLPVIQAGESAGLVNDAGDGVRAVSYTHLDVYKRQRLRS